MFTIRNINPGVCEVTADVQYMKSKKIPPFKLDWIPTFIDVHGKLTDDIHTIDYRPANNALYRIVS